MYICVHVCLAFLHRYFESQKPNFQGFICKSLVGKLCCYFVKIFASACSQHYVCHCNSYGLQKSITLLGHFTHLTMGLEKLQCCVKLHKFMSHESCLLYLRVTSTTQSMGCFRNTSYAHGTSVYFLVIKTPVYFVTLLRSQVAAKVSD